MRDSAYWICLSVGWDHSRPRGRRWDALVVSVQPTDELPQPDPQAMAAERPGRVVVWGVWAPHTGWTLLGQAGPARLEERFASCAFEEQGPFRAALRLGTACAMRLALGLTDRDREPFPPPGDN